MKVYQLTIYLKDYTFPRTMLFTSKESALAEAEDYRNGCFRRSVEVWLHEWESSHVGPGWLSCKESRMLFSFGMPSK